MMKWGLFLLASGFVMSAQAAVFKCTDAAGNQVYRAAPCADGFNNAELNLKSGSVVSLDEQKEREALKQKQQQLEREQAQLEQEQMLHQQAQLVQEAAEESAKNQAIIKGNPTQYSAFAMPPYALDSLPALVKLYAPRVPDIERFRRLAAVQALASGRCGRVEAVELNEKSTVAALMILVDCSTAARFYLTEQELVR
jgi:hypothetical protein